jgi:phosphoribosylformylglycinamidine synthase
LVGYTVSNLGLNPWEFTVARPHGIASSMDIMQKAPLGACSFNNEFGRPGLVGYFRTFSQKVGGQVWGYHKPVMIAGGMGVIRPMHTHKREIPAGALLCVLGGHSMLIGLGGGAASSATGGSDERRDLDFASVQRENPEMVPFKPGRTNR